MDQGPPGRRGMPPSRPPARNHHDRSRSPHGGYPAISVEGLWQHPPKEQLVAKVKSQERRLWFSFCDESLGRNSPEHYPSACLLAFLENRPAPSLQELMDHVDVLSHEELVVCCKAAVQQGASPPEAKGDDFSKYAEPELAEYLQDSCIEYSSEGKRTRWPSFYERSKVEQFPAADLVTLVKQCNYRPWHDFCNETLLKYMPSAYPAHYLVAFLVGDGPPEEGAPEEGAPETADATDSAMDDAFGALSTEELIDLCTAAVEDGYPPLEGDPSLYSRDDLLQYLRAHGDDNTEITEEEKDQDSNWAEVKPEQGETMGEDEMERLWQTTENVVEEPEGVQEPEGDDVAPSSRMQPGSFLSLLREV